MAALIFWGPYLLIATGLFVTQVVRFMTGDRKGALRFLAALAGATLALAVCHLVLVGLLVGVVWLMWGAAALLAKAPVLVKQVVGLAIVVAWCVVAVYLTWRAFGVGFRLGVALYDGSPLPNVWTSKASFPWWGTGVTPWRAPSEDHK